MKFKDGNVLFWFDRYSIYHYQGHRKVWKSRGMGADQTRLRQPCTIRIWCGSANSVCDLCARVYAILMYATVQAEYLQSLADRWLESSVSNQLSLSNIITKIEVEQWSHGFWFSQFLQYWSAKALNFRSTIGLFHVIHQLTVLTNSFWQDQIFDYELLPLTLSIDLQR